MCLSCVLYIAFREFKIKVYITHFILLIHYSLFGYGNQVCVLLGWGGVNRLTTLTCVTFIWSHKKMSGIPCNLFCRKLALTEKDMLHQTVLEKATTTNNNNPSKTRTKTNTAKLFPELQQSSYSESDLWLTFHIYAFLIH